jgi:DNA-binding CsgD family transcriptional regulator
MKNEPNVKKKELNRTEEIILEDSNLLTKKDVARILKIHPGTVDRYVKAGILKVKKIGSAAQCRCYYSKIEVVGLLGL